LPRPGRSWGWLPIGSGGGSLRSPELRTYRRLSGDTTHLPVEMDVLRALERDADVEAAYALLRRLGANRPALDEGRVVYASFLLDHDRAGRPGS